MTYSRRFALASMGGAIVTAGNPIRVAKSLPMETKFGVNFNRLFLGPLNSQMDGRVGLAKLAQKGIPFVRFAASGQWASDWAKFVADPSRYWQEMDAIFSAAEHCGVALIPCVLWHTPALTMYCGGAMQDWNISASKIRRLADSYTTTFVERYDKSSALMMYEFTNELNDWVDLPPNILMKFWPKKDPSMPARQPVAQDRLTSVQLREIMESFVGIIRATSKKPISLGSNIPRPNAWHLSQESNFDTDSVDQNMNQLRAVTPMAADVLSIHLYNDKYGQPKSAFRTLPEVLSSFVAAAELDGRKSFIGEFGVAREGDKDLERRQFTSQLQTIRSSGVNYAAIWNYSPQSFQPEWDVSSDNDRAYQLDMIREANRY